MLSTGTSSFLLILFVAFVHMVVIAGSESNYPKWWLDISNDYLVHKDDPEVINHDWVMYCDGHSGRMRSRKECLWTLFLWTHDGFCRKGGRLGNRCVEKPWKVLLSCFPTQYWLESRVECMFMKKHCPRGWSCKPRDSKNYS